MRPAARGGRARRCRRRTASGATRRASARPRCASAVRRWLARRFGVDVPIAQIAACIGTKEFVGTLPQWLHLRTPDRDTVLYPAVAYPTYEMGAILAGCRPVPCRPTPGSGSTSTPSTRPTPARALCLWVNTPGNPTGALDDLGAAAAWGRAHGVPVFSDECYVRVHLGRTAAHDPRARARRRGRRPLAVEALQPGRPAGRLLRRRRRAGRTTCRRCASTSGCWCRARRRPPGWSPWTTTTTSPCSASATARRLELHGGRAVEVGRASTSPLPAGGFYLWFDGRRRLGRSPNAWRAEGGALVSPGEFYGTEGADHVRVAVVQPLDRLDLVVERLGVT